MISEAKLAANKRNSLKGGVKSREGKLKSRRNARAAYRAVEMGSWHEYAGKVVVVLSPLSGEPVPVAADD